MWEDKLKVYKTFRRAVEADVKDLEKERQKLLRRKKNKKERTRMLLKNSVERLAIMCQCLKSTYKHYENIYFENDYYRAIRLLEIQMN